jgi:hypothetical protein
MLKTRCKTAWRRAAESLHISAKWIYLLVAVTAMAIPGTASAQTNHYARTVTPSFPGGWADQGLSVNIDTHSVQVVSCNDFVDHETWYNTDSGTSWAWVETGVTTGYKVTGGCVTNAIFWADQRNGGGGYHEHFPSVSWSTDVWYTLQITKSASCSWAVQFGGVGLGTSNSNCPGATRGAFVGIEATAVSPGYAAVKGWSGGYARKDSTGTWYSNWDLNRHLEWISAPQPDIQSMWSDTGTEEVLNVAF